MSIFGSRNHKHPEERFHKDDLPWVPPLDTWSTDTSISCGDGMLNLKVTFAVGQREHKIELPPRATKYSLGEALLLIEDALPEEFALFASGRYQLQTRSGEPRSPLDTVQHESYIQVIATK